MEFNLPKIEWRDLNDIKLNDRNPRKIDEDKFSLLKNNIQRYPKMLAVRPVVIDQHGVIRGGNMRYRAVRELDWHKVPTIIFDETWTEEEMKMFVVVDNQGFGQWDYDILGADYDTSELELYGIDFSYNLDSEEYADEGDTSSGGKEVKIEAIVKQIKLYSKQEEISLEDAMSRIWEELG